jgi:hypothetical protein
MGRVVSDIRRRLDVNDARVAEIAWSMELVKSVTFERWRTKRGGGSFQNFDVCCLLVGTLQRYLGLITPFASEFLAFYQVEPG